MKETSLTQDTGLFSDARIALIRNTVAKDAPEDVFRAMVDIAQKRNLDPLAKQIQCVKFGGSWQYITTIDGHRAIAEQTGQYAGNDAPVFTWHDPAKKSGAGKRIPESATVTVYKMLAGQRMPFSATVFWEEYDGGRNNWVSMPCTMLAKVAESHALRKAFPAVLSGTYTGDEMDQAGYVEVAGAVANRDTGEVAHNRQGGSGTLAATDRQRALIQAIAREQKISGKALEDLSRERTGQSFADLSRQNASTLVESLRDIPLQSRQERPQRAERPAPRVEVMQAGGDDDDSAAGQMRQRLHRYTHDHKPLHNWAVSLKFASLKDVPMPQLVELANKISKPAGCQLFMAEFGDAPGEHPGADFEVMDHDDPLAADADTQAELINDPELHAEADRRLAAARARN